MLTINQDIVTNLRENPIYTYVPTVANETPAGHDQEHEVSTMSSYEAFNQSFYNGFAERELDLESLNGGHHHVYDAEEAKSYEKMMFDAMTYLHLFMFFAIPFSFYLKRK
jgi:hypothetical protein